MTAPLDEKGLLPCPFCGAQANSHQVRARSVRFVCPDCEASGPIADGNPEQEQVWEDARIAWNRRAYLAASSSPSEMDELSERLLSVATDIERAFLHRIDHSGEDWRLVNPDGETAAAIMREAQSALAAKDAEITRWQQIAQRAEDRVNNEKIGYVRLHDFYEAAEARIKALEEALRPFAFEGLQTDIERFDGETKIEVHFPRTSPRKAIPAAWVYVENVLSARLALKENAL